MRTLRPQAVALDQPCAASSVQRAVASTGDAAAGRLGATVRHQYAQQPQARGQQGAAGAQHLPSCTQGFAVECGPQRQRHLSHLPQQPAANTSSMVATAASATAQYTQYDPASIVAQVAPHVASASVNEQRAMSFQGIAAPASTSMKYPYPLQQQQLPRVTPSLQQERQTSQAQVQAQLAPKQQNVTPLGAEEAFDTHVMPSSDVQARHARAAARSYPVPAVPCRAEVSTTARSAEVWPSYEQVASMETMPVLPPQEAAATLHASVVANAAESSAFRNAFSQACGSARDYAQRQQHQQPASVAQRAVPSPNPSAQSSPSYVCPDCHEKFSSFEAVRTHLNEVHQMPIQPQQQPQQQGPARIVENTACASQVQSASTHLCPDCRVGFPSLEAVRTHWIEKHQQHTDSTQSQATTAELEAASSVVQAEKVTSHLCPDCHAKFATLDAVRAHWLATHNVHAESKHPSTAAAVQADETYPQVQEQPLDTPRPPVEAKRVVKHICPDCGLACASLEEAREHWLKEHHQLGDGAVLQGDREADGGATETTQAQLLEVDKMGRPVIVRHTDKESGASRTVVMNEDGTRRAFGEDTVSSMLSRTNEDLQQWFEAMEDHHFRGLVNELTHRLCEHSQKLFRRREEFEEELHRANFAYFGLEEGVTIKELDNAYRKLARSMHPDKNGGTEEAKRKFQDMKEKYEELKEFVTTSGGAASGKKRPPPSGAEDEEAANSEETQERNHDDPSKGMENSQAQGGDGQSYQEENENHGASQKDRDEEECRAQGKAKGGGDCKGGGEGLPGEEKQDGAGSSAGGGSPEETSGREKRTGLEEKAWKMLGQLKMIGQNLRIVEANFERLGTMCAQ